MPPLQFVVDRRDAGQTLAAVLKTRFGIPWAQAKRLVENKHVKVSGQVETDTTRRLKLGKRVELAAGTVEIKRTATKAEGSSKAEGGRSSKAEGGRSSKAEGGRRKAEEEKAADAKAENRRRKAEKTEKPEPKRERAAVLDPACIVYLDDAMVVVNKPAGLTTVRNEEEVAEFGARGGRFLTRTLAGMLPAAVGAPDRPVFAVHRLDRDTSGLVAFARTRAAAESLTAQFRKHATERRYLALTRGVPPVKRIESTLVRDRGDGRRGSSTDLADDGKRAVTRVAVVETFGRFALVECRLETGRTHQVRIHLGEAGAPLCGEAVYDRTLDGKRVSDGSGAARPMLHAARLGLAHPESGTAVSWEAPPPADFAALLTRFRAGAE